MITFNQTEIELLVQNGFWDCGDADNTEFEKTGNWVQLNCGCCQQWTSWTVSKLSDTEFNVHMFESRGPQRSDRKFTDFLDVILFCS